MQTENIYYSKLCKTESPRSASLGIALARSTTRCLHTLYAYFEQKSKYVDTSVNTFHHLYTTRPISTKYDADFFLKKTPQQFHVDMKRTLSKAIYHCPRLYNTKKNFA